MLEAKRNKILVGLMVVLALSANMTASANPGFLGPFWNWIVNRPTNASWSFEGLSDIPSPVGQAGKTFTRNAEGTAFEWVLGTYTYWNANVGINFQTGTYTLVLTDVNKLICVNNVNTALASTVSILIPPIASVTFSAGNQIQFIRIGAGEVRICKDAESVILGSVASPPTTPWLLQQYSAALAIYVGTNTWYVIGHLKDGY